MADLTYGGEEFTLVWNGTLSRMGVYLLPPRDTTRATWSPRKYTRTGNHTKEKRMAKKSIQVRPALYGRKQETPPVKTSELGWTDRQLAEAEPNRFSEVVDTGGSWE